MISGGLEGRIPYMTYPEPWGGPPKQHPEFLRPAPKPLPPISRYNGVSISPSLNGSRLGQLQRTPIKYPSPPSSAATIADVKEESVEDTTYSAYSSLFPPHPSYHPAYHNSGPYSTLYQPPYTPLLRSNYAPPLSPLEPPYTPNTPSSISHQPTFLPSSSTFNPSQSTFSVAPSTYSLSPSTFSSSQSNFSPPTSLQPPLPPPQPMTRIIDKKPSANFKIPTGKEGSMKHRILTRPGEPTNIKVPLDLQKVPDSPKLSENIKKRITATASPSRSPSKSTNNNLVLGENFKRGSLIKLASGEFRKIEDMRTEDFVNSAERSTDLRLADSTVVKIEQNPSVGTTTVTLSYNQRRTQVEFEATLEHPFFVYGQGWASCAPERTHQAYGIKAHRLQVGDILISLTPREAPQPAASIHGSTIITTATTTAVTARQLSSSGNCQSNETIVHSYPSMKLNQFTSANHYTTSTSQLMIPSTVQPIISQQNFLPPQSSSPDCVNSRKRRWSAPDEICDEDEQSCRKVNT